MEVETKRKILFALSAFSLGYAACLLFNKKVFEKAACHDAMILREKFLQFYGDIKEKSDDKKISV